MFQDYFVSAGQKLIRLVLIVSLVLSPTMGYAQSVLLPAPDKMITMTAAFTPVILKGMVIHPEDPLKFDFLMDTGSARATGEDLRVEADKAIKYFLASLTVPQESMWVNLSPVEKDRVIPEAFGKTVMGRDLLGEDYVLKQLASSLLYPESDLGKEFWTKIYELSQRELGTTDIDVSQFNRVWIEPDTAQVWENDGKAIILKSHLKVMLENDYLAENKHRAQSAEHRAQSVEQKVDNGEQGTTASTAPSSGLQALSSSESTKQVFRQVLLPVLEKEINEGAHFARLRQIYSAMILSSWYKIRLKESLLSKAYADKNKVTGVDFKEGFDKEAIYARYLEAVKKGVFNYIKEEPDFQVSAERRSQSAEQKADNGEQGTTASTAPSSGLPASSIAVIPRRYFSGGFEGAMLSKVVAAGLIVAALLGLSPEARAQAEDATRPKGDMVLVAAGVQDVGPKADGGYLADAGQGIVSPDASGKDSESAMLNIRSLRQKIHRARVASMQRRLSALSSRDIVRMLTGINSALAIEALENNLGKGTIEWIINSILKDGLSSYYADDRSQANKILRNLEQFFLNKSSPEDSQVKKVLLENIDILKKAFPDNFAIKRTETAGNAGDGQVNSYEIRPTSSDWTVILHLGNKTLEEAGLKDEFKTYELPEQYPIGTTSESVEYSLVKGIDWERARSFMLQLTRDNVVRKVAELRTSISELAMAKEGVSAPAEKAMLGLSWILWKHTGTELESRVEAYLRKQDTKALVKLVKYDNKLVRMKAVDRLIDTRDRDGLLDVGAPAVPRLVEKLKISSGNERGFIAQTLQSLSWAPQAVDEKVPFYAAFQQWDKLVGFGAVAVPVLVAKLIDSEERQDFNAYNNYSDVLFRLKDDNGIFRYQYEEGGREEGPSGVYVQDDALQASGWLGDSPQRYRYNSRYWAKVDRISRQEVRRVDIGPGSWVEYAMGDLASLMKKAPLKLKMNLGVVAVSDAVAFIERHPMLTAGYTQEEVKAEMAMVSEALQWISQHPYLGSLAIGSAVGLLANLQKHMEVRQGLFSLGAAMAIWPAFIAIGGLFLILALPGTIIAVVPGFMEVKDFYKQNYYLIPALAGGGMAVTAKALGMALWGDKFNPPERAMAKESTGGPTEPAMSVKTKIVTGGLLAALLASGFWSYTVDLFQIRSPFIDVAPEFVQPAYRYPTDIPVKRIVVGDISKDLENAGLKVKTERLSFVPSFSSQGTSEFDFRFKLTNSSSARKSIGTTFIIAYGEGPNPVRTIQQTPVGRFAELSPGQSMDLSVSAPVTEMVKQVVIVVVMEDRSIYTFTVAGVDKLVEKQFLNKDKGAEKAMALEKELMTTLVPRDEIKATDKINDIVILGNDDFDTFRHALRLYRDYGADRFVVVGGKGRMTETLIQKARASDVPVIDESSEAAVIQRIMEWLVEREAEFASLRGKLPKFDPETKSTNTPENIKNYREKLPVDIGKNGQPYRIVYLHAPHQQLRAKMTVKKYLADVIQDGRLVALGNTSEYDFSGRSQGQIVEDILGDAVRLILYSSRGNDTIADVDQDENFPADFWTDAAALFESLPEAEKDQMARSLFAITKGLKKATGKGPVAVSVEEVLAAIPKAQKDFLGPIVERVRQKESVASLRNDLHEWFDSARSAEEKFAALIGPKRFERTPQGFVPRQMDGISLSYLLGADEEGRKVQQQLAGQAVRLKAALSDELRNKVVFLDPASYHVTTVDIAALKKEYRPFQAKMKTMIAAYMQNLPARFRNGIPAKVVGIDMFAAKLGILKFKLEMDRSFLDDFGREIWGYLATDPDLKNIYPDVPFKPGEVTYHMTVGYIMEPLAGQEVNQLADALEGSFDPARQVSYIQPVGELTGYTDMNTFFLLGEAAMGIDGVGSIQPIQPIARVQNDLKKRQPAAEAQKKGKASAGQGTTTGRGEDTVEISDAARAKLAAEEGKELAMGKDLGGIDLDASKLDLQIKRDGNGVALPVSEQSWDAINIQGFIPVIYRIEPVNMSVILGLNADSLENDPVSAGANGLPVGREPDLVGV
ncbi:MAG: YdcF family protein [Candidatus Omnitrophica bacterium]|nr:YdcF family protein [Candidatus Omnitrophota bacterium]